MRDKRRSMAPQCASCSPGMTPGCTIPPQLLAATAAAAAAAQGARGQASDPRLGATADLHGCPGRPHQCTAGAGASQARVLHAIDTERTIGRGHARKPEPHTTHVQAVTVAGCCCCLLFVVCCCCCCCCWWWCCCCVGHATHTRKVVGTMAAKKYASAGLPQNCMSLLAAPAPSPSSADGPTPRGSSKK